MTCEMPDAFCEVRRKARKEHKCCECRKVIAKGETYIYSSGIWDHRPDSYKTCDRCDRVKTLAIKRYPPAFIEEGPGFGELRYYIREMARIGRRR